jgi:hypothetical protein
MTCDKGGASPIKFFLLGMIAVGLIVGNAESTAAASTKKNVRKAMTAAQKVDLRKKGYEWCRKNFIRASAHILRVEILSDGRVRCWYRG